MSSSLKSKNNPLDIIVGSILKPTDKFTERAKSPQNVVEKKVDPYLEVSSWPEILQSNASILRIDEHELVRVILGLKQGHIFDNWDKGGINDSKKHLFFKQLKALNDPPGSLENYLERAKRLLRSSANGENPLDGWIPEVPTGISLDGPTSTNFISYQSRGLHELQFCGFILVAGGLGERLGYSGIKVALPTQMTTEMTYLELYCKQILNIQRKYGNGKLLPLAIMVSDDTFEQTLNVLNENNHYGLLKAQVKILKQEKVVSMTNNDGKIAMKNTYEIDTKPHGHGDIHSLMYSTGTAKKWLNYGVKWCVFFQDTNSLAFNTIPASLGVSALRNLEVNTLTCPRVAKAAMGAIVKLKTADGKQSITVNVEYNQLDPLLRANSYAEGDTNSSTGFSPFPGNTNQLIFRMEPYVENLNNTNGIMGEFVNPKYADSTKTHFKKPTRLECMMQDYPKVLNANAKVGFTTVPSWLAYSPCKNNVEDAANAAKANIPPSCAFTSESDHYNAVSEILRRHKVNIENGNSQTFQGITATIGPRIVIDPSTAMFPCQIQDCFPSPEKVKISARSTLILEGDVKIYGLNLDGALHLIAVPGTRLSVFSKPALCIRNEGHIVKPIDSLINVSEIDRMRGYVIEKKDTKVISTEYAFKQDLESLKSCTGDYVYTGNGLILADAYDPNFFEELGNHICSSCSFFL